MMESGQIFRMDGDGKAKTAFCARTVSKRSGTTESFRPCLFSWGQRRRCFFAGLAGLDGCGFPGLADFFGRAVCLPLPGFSARVGLPPLAFFGREKPPEAEGEKPGGVKGEPEDSGRPACFLSLKTGRASARPTGSDTMGLADRPDGAGADFPGAAGAAGAGRFDRDCPVFLGFSFRRGARGVSVAAGRGVSDSSIQSRKSSIRLTRSTWATVTRMRLPMPTTRLVLRSTKVSPAGLST